MQPQASCRNLHSYEENQMEIKIDPEFEKLIPTMAYEEFLGLEESIKKEGNREPVTIWEGKKILLDGHNRYKICKAHKITLKKPIKLDFESRENAMEWVINNQLERRNLGPYQRGVIALKLEPIYKGRQGGDRRSEEFQEASIGTLKGKTRDIIAKRVGIKHSTLDKIKVIEKKATPEQKKKLIAGERTVSSVYKDIEQEEIKRGIREPLPKEKFSIIYADPPWEYKWDKTRGSAAKHYNTESIDYLKKIKIPSEKNCVLFLWATNPKLNEALELIEAWGFEYKTNMAWIKDKFGTGYWVRGQHELLLIATKGKVKTPPKELRISSILKAKRTKHSKKPEEFYEIIEKMFPGMKYIEMFARKKRKNWVSWGNEKL